MKKELDTQKNFCLNSKLFVLLALLAPPFLPFAQVKPNSLFTDNLVLQRNIEVPVWGTAANTETVTVSFHEQTVTANVKEGKWFLKLRPMKESSEPASITIKGNTNTVIVKNVLIGEVWLAGGQSNMERQLGLRGGQKPLLNWVEEAATANYPLLREFSLPHNNNVSVPVESVNATWKICDSSNVKQFSAIGYYFAKEIFLKLKVPVGIIHSSWGGTPAEKWISREALERDPELKKIVAAYDKALADYPARLAAYKSSEAASLQKWAADTLLAKQGGQPFPRKPAPPTEPTKSGDCGGLYTTMIAPLIPFAIKGVIWYQGEANCGREQQYQSLFPAMIADWREKWQEGNFPFLFVQLAPFRTNTPELREAQLLTLQKSPNTAMVVTLDCGDTTDIHPANKEPVGQRLALAARALAYREKKLEYSGPLYRSYKIEGSKIVISFTHTGSGLAVRDAALQGFTISADGKNFIPATAIIKKDKVILSAVGIDAPTAVRYAFRNNGTGNLYNKEMLPASPFRTDLP